MKTYSPRTSPRRAFPAGVAFLLLIVAGLAAPAAARGGPGPQRSREPEVSAQLSTGVAKLGEQVVLTISVLNAREARLAAVPEVEGLRLGSPAGPFSSQYTSIVNGRVSERIETKWQVAVRSSQEGHFEIGAFELTVDGQTVRTRPVTLKVLRDLRGENIGFFELRPSLDRVVEGQPFTLELRFGWDAGANVNYANLSLPWWDALPGMLELERKQDQSPTNAVVVNDEFQVGVERLPMRSGEGRHTFRLVRSFLPTRSGQLEFPTSFLEFGQKSEPQIFRAQRKLSNYFVRAAPFALEVVPLPREGQPYDYSGAVGVLEARASADTRDVVVGDSIKLTVDWTGEGNLEFFQAPDLALFDAFRGFHVYGATEEKSFERRRVVYDLAPLDPEVESIPPVPLSVFDPLVSAYATLETDPIPIRVRPLERPVELADKDASRFERDIVDIDAGPLGAGGSDGAGVAGGLAARLTDRGLAAGFGGALVLWVALRTWSRRRRGDPDAPLERRRRRARRTLAKCVRAERDPAGRLTAFTSFLAARTREPDQAWLGRDALAFAGGAAEREEWRAAADVLARLERAAFGGGDAVPDDELLRAADRLVRCGL